MLLKGGAGGTSGTNTSSGTGQVKTTTNGGMSYENDVYSKSPTLLRQSKLYEKKDSSNILTYQITTNGYLKKGQKGANGTAIDMTLNQIATPLVLR